MSSKLITAAVLGAALAMAAVPAANAQSGRGSWDSGTYAGAAAKFGQGGGPVAGGRHSGGGGGGPHISGGIRHGGGPQISGGFRHGYARHRGGYGYGYVVPYYSFDSYAFVDDDDEDCSYLWRRYQRTGNPKWKYRYYDCID